MVEQTLDDHLIVQYLLGCLAEEETERLDELAIGNDEFAARLDTIENDLVDSYVSGKLSGQTLEQFESFYLSSPRRREKVRFARAFQGTTAGNVVATQIESRNPKPAADLQSVRRRRGFFESRPAALWMLATAALLIMAAGLALQNLRLRNQIGHSQTEQVLLQQRERDLRSELEEQRGAVSENSREMESLRDKIAQLEQPHAPELSPRLSVVTLDLLPQTRGIGQPPTLSIPAGANLVKAQVELEPGEYASYGVQLRSLPNRQIVWRGGNLRPTTKGDRRLIAISLNPGLLKSQMYMLDVTGTSAGGGSEPAGTYTFRVVKQ